ncbi:MAG: T9SS type A sorting domain-containing protein [Chitinophagales bacterium]|nr:T9SS type A sorting domain-containing protein [Chitinophagales bacterium]
MKSIFILLTFFCCFAYDSSAQWSLYQAFEYPRDKFSDRFIFDTTHHNNSWQIGRPQKSIFDSAYSKPNAIVTDTVNPYPTNDTSVFVVKCVKDLQHRAVLGFGFHYRLHIDSGDYGKVEVSGDGGVNWIDIVDDYTTYDFQWLGIDGKPQFDKTTNGWKELKVDMSKWGLHDTSSHKYPSYVTADTFLIRVTFISDSIPTTYRNGWIIDDFFYEDWYESVETISNNNLISIYPNPAQDHIYIRANYTYYTKPVVSIYNQSGQEVLQETNVSTDGYLNIDLPNGIYTLRYSTDKEVAVKQLVISK